VTSERLRSDVARIVRSPHTAAFLLESSTMEEGGACARLASGFFYGLVSQTQSSR
jgi:hypothetical protein